ACASSAHVSDLSDGGVVKPLVVARRSGADRFGRLGPARDRRRRAAVVLGSRVVLGSDDIVQVAHAASSPRDLFTPLIACLRDHLESDVSMLHVAAAYPVTRCGPVASLGFDTERMHAL